MPITAKQQPPYYEQGSWPKIYKAIINQTGTNAPTAIILKNTYPTFPQWTYDGVGEYILIMPTGTLNYNKTTIEYSGNESAAWIQSSENDVDELYFSTALASNSNTLANDLLRHVTITITQYL